MDARYDRSGDAVQLVFRSGVSMTIPTRFIPGLQGQPAAALESVAVSPAGDALLWTSLDADVYVPGLVERVFGDRLFEATAGPLARRRRSTAKRAAGRARAH